MYQLDNLIDKIAESLLDDLDKGYDDTTLEMIKALSDLVSARASLNY